MDVKEKLVELLADLYSCDPAYYDVDAWAIAQHLVDHAVASQKWISVDDRLPDNKEYDWVLAQVVEDNGFMHIPTVMEYRQSKNDWFEETYGWLSDHNGAFTVTHWMPLPEPPKGE